MDLSVIDLATVLPGETRHDALMHSIEVAQHIEKKGFRRIWVAEHHGSRMIAGRAPEVLIAAIASQTSSIRVGSGSVLLNHYSPFKVAEVFCTLNELYPGRIDLGAGRATTGPVLDFALQQDKSKQFHSNSEQQLAELVAWLDNSFPANHAFAGSPIHTLDEKPQLHLLGSSIWSAQAAAQLGLRYAFAGFINQQGTPSIIQTYREQFKPSYEGSGISKPDVILAVHVVCADTLDEARRQLAPVHVMYRNLSKGILDIDIPGPDDAVKELGGLPLLPTYQRGSGIPPKFIGGTFESVRQQLEELAADLSVQELLIQDMMTDHQARLHAYDLLAGMIAS